ncbi:MAG: hypothetical protein AB9880_10915 [Christensenellales bacterium]
MKKTLLSCFLLVAALAWLTQASAAGRLDIVQENLHQIPYYDKTVTCYYFAELTNSGDKPVEFTRGLLELYDPAGNSVESLDISECYPRVVQPGENAFISAYRSVDTAQHTIADQMLSMMQQGKLTQKIQRLTSQARFEKVDDGYSVYDYLVCEIKNSSGAVARNVDVVFSVRDEAGKILWVSYYSWRGYDVGLMPDSSMELRIRVDSSFSTFWTDTGLVPAKVDALAYISTGV